MIRLLRFPILFTVIVAVVAVTASALIGGQINAAMIAYSVNCPSERATTIYIMDVERGVNYPLTGKQERAREPSWSPAGDQIVYVYSGSAGQLQSDLIIADAFGDNRQWLTRDVSEEAMPIWSPDGETILFVQSNLLDDPGRLMSLNLVTGERRIIRSNRRHQMMYGPGWSPDGAQLLYTSIWLQNGAPQFELSLIDFQRDETRAISDNQQNQYYTGAFSPDGDQLAVAYYDKVADHAVISLMADSIGASQPLTTLSNDTTLVYPLRWAPDGERLGFIWTTVDAVDGESHQGLYMTLTQSGDLNRIHIDCNILDFSWRP
jgi:Tol biopolymer transport system component